MSKVKDLFLDLKTEAKRIRWSKGKELVNNVIVTLVTVIFFALFFMGIQLLVSLCKGIDFNSIIKTIQGWF
jgi:preprotein translocase subunit SecE